MLFFFEHVLNIFFEINLLKTSNMKAWQVCLSHLQGIKCNNMVAARNMFMQRNRRYVQFLYRCVTCCSDGDDYGDCGLLEWGGVQFGRQASTFRREIERKIVLRKTHRDCKRANVRWWSWNVVICQISLNHTPQDSGLYVASCYNTEVIVVWFWKEQPRNTTYLTPQRGLQQLSNDRRINTYAIK